MGLEKDLPPGEELVVCFRPFIEHLAASSLSPKTMTTVYILMAIRWEENDLIESHGEQYIQYRESVPMFIPNGSTMRGVSTEANEPTAEKAA